MPPTETLVLLSGGIDSATVLALTASIGLPLTTLFVDYGQPAAQAELRASLAVASHYGASHRQVSLTGTDFPPGEVRGRNAFLLHAALLIARPDAAVVAIGVHAGTPYRDCTSSFLRAAQASYDFHTDGVVTISAPFIDREKREIVALARLMDVPLDLTYSCEAGNEPCWDCLSCRDREAYIASA
jgi:7-cyano-7-deazaguanine synthase